MKLIIAGGRDYQFTDIDRDDLRHLFKEQGVTEGVSGCASGADTEGELFCLTLGIPVKRFPARWKELGKMAGFRRNEEMAMHADAVVLFPGGKGTAHMHQMAIKHKLKIFDWRE